MTPAPLFTKEAGAASVALDVPEVVAVYLRAACLSCTIVNITMLIHQPGPNARTSVRRDSTFGTVAIGASSSTKVE